jgi:hypothetical protein
MLHGSTRETVSQTHFVWFNNRGALPHPHHCSTVIASRNPHHFSGQKLRALLFGSLCGLGYAYNAGPLRKDEHTKISSIVQHEHHQYGSTRVRCSVPFSSKMGNIPSPIGWPPHLVLAEPLKVGDRRGTNGWVQASSTSSTTIRQHVQ